MDKFLKLAALSWAKATLNIQKFADAYVGAVARFNDKARERFALAYPMFGPREWRRLELVGSHELLPQFMFKSDAFVGKLLKFPNSMKCQKALVSALKNGYIRVDRGKGPESVSLDSLTKSDEKAITLLMNETDANLKPSELLNKFRSMVVSVNKRNESKGKPAWQISIVNGKTVARFNRACTLGRPELIDIVDLMDAGKGAVGHHGSGATMLIARLVDAIVDLEALRDEEWDFEESHGPSRECWTAEEENEHERLLDRIQNSRICVRDLVREATCNKNMEV